MNGKTKLVLGIAILATLVVGASITYSLLSETFAPVSQLSTPEPTQTSSSQSEESTSEATQENAQEEEQSTSEATQEEQSDAVYAVDFTVQDLDGNTVKLSDYYGKPIVLNFWASWCPPCKEEMPDFDKVNAELGEDVQFLMVNMTDSQGGESVSVASSYIEENGFTFPVLYDVDQEAAYTYGVRSLPTTYFIDENEEIVAGVQGSINEEILLEGISRIYDIVEPEEQSEQSDNS